jgi:hypothetical protein
MLSQSMQAATPAREYLSELPRKLANDVLHVATALPPSVCGVGDYGFCVNEKIGQISGAFPLLFAPQMNQPVADRALHLERTLEQIQAVILEYSLYAYQQYGIPYWLLRVLSRWKASGSAKRMITVFHELYATGKIWSTAFWTSPPQRYVSRKIAELSDGGITTTHRQADILRVWNPAMKLAVLSVPSNVGELPFEQIGFEREISLVVFGQAGTRKRAYLGNETGWTKIRSWMPNAVIHDVGPPTGLAVSELTGLCCIHHGHLSAQETSALLRNSQFGILDYANSTLDKSGVFAAYCAHGVFPIVLRHSTPANSAVREGEHFWSPDSLKTHANNFRQLSRNAHLWYRGHDLAEHSRTICDLLTATAASTVEVRVRAY